MKYLLPSIIFLCLIACTRDQDDLTMPCTADCTTIKGRFVTLNNQGIEGIQLKLEYRNPQPVLGSRTTFIRETVTDSDGNYEMEFYANDDQLGSDAAGYFRVNVNADNLDENTFFRLTTSSGYAIHDLNRRDTTIDLSFYLPQKAWITVDLNNYAPIDGTDFFEVQTLYPFGLDIGSNPFLGIIYYTAFSVYGIF